MDLDKTNEILFEYLLAYARFSIKDLARILNVSKATVIKRINYLETSKYVLRYDAIINWQRLPFIKKVYFVKTDKKEFESQVLENKLVFSLITLSGLYNYQVWCFFKTKQQEKDFEKSLKEFEFQEITISQLVFPKVSFFNVPKKMDLPQFKEKDLKLSEIDIKIMKYMAQGHARDSFYQMSKSLKIPYDSVHYHGKLLLKNNYFIALVAQPGTNQFTLQTTSLLISCKSQEASDDLYNLLKTTPYIMSDAKGTKNKLLVHFLSQTHVQYRETLSKILSLIDKSFINDVLITHWDQVLLNNRYPLEYLLEKK